MKEKLNQIIFEYSYLTIKLTLNKENIRKSSPFNYKSKLTTNKRNHIPINKL